MEEKNTMPNKKPHMKKPPIFWITVVLLGFMLITTLFSATRLIGGKAEVVDYSAFIRMSFWKISSRISLTIPLDRRIITVCRMYCMTEEST